MYDPKKCDPPGYLGEFFGADNVDFADNTITGIAV